MMLGARLSSLEERQNRIEGPAIEDVALLDTSTPGLLDSVADGSILGRAVRVRRYRDEDAGFANEPHILGGDIETVRAAVGLEEAAVPFRMIDDSLEIKLVARAFEQQPASRMAEN